MKLSARNQLKGIVKEIKMGAINAKVTIDINGQMLTSVVTIDAIEDLGIKVGDEVTSVIKSSSVMLMVD
ncbi:MULTISPECIES: TOBE domain-containing protein [Romboutsia]|uniref:Molybdate/tungstate binding, C-terminal n=1 Tax=Romboutsia hominis TaxID=1507512 RepID=A0A2P2BSS0_9FIRM|nr:MULTISPECIES: TOBE domain-containing protein [Romboutsia]MCH1960657.1 TOBE domain-containing protein [Romboutsia hominis]MCH1968911.1 TOBE domain-containing protein [Romboutsia hominis]MDB8792080.1 TOBE domain-containing protein [Romboutsia sp. 1001216sp1]MDB8793569.1 TOBE domain-containing protein [Romboutsia sp. 1001216sp1]MDB8794966.1 TOBE domain-containing protein [Romboutsia sp. 1001216sp1]